MKAMIDGVWHPQVDDRAVYEAARAAQPGDLFHGWVHAPGAGDFAAEAGRYHLYVSYACPFAHRAILMRALKGLEATVPLSVVHPRWSGPDGWVFAPDPAFPEVTEDKANGQPALWRIYRKAAPDFTGRVTVPVLWDSVRRTIVSTESADIMRMFDTVFEAFATKPHDFYPPNLRSGIDQLASFIRSRINGGVYAVGFAATQADYDVAVTRFFAALDEIEARLADGRPYFLGRQATEADWLLFPTLVRFDAVYVGALKCNVKTLRDYPWLTALTRRLYAWPSVAETVKLHHVKRHYYDDLGEINAAIVPAGPSIDFRSAA